MDCWTLMAASNVALSWQHKAMASRMGSSWGLANGGQRGRYGCVETARYSAKPWLCKRYSTAGYVGDVPWTNYPNHMNYRIVYTIYYIRMYIYIYTYYIFSGSNLFIQLHLHLSRLWSKRRGSSNSVTDSDWLFGTSLAQQAEMICKRWLVRQSMSVCWRVTWMVWLARNYIKQFLDMQICLCIYIYMYMYVIYI